MGWPGSRPQRSLRIPRKPGAEPATPRRPAFQPARYGHRHSGRLVIHGDAQAPARLGGHGRHRGEGLREFLPGAAKAAGASRDGRDAVDHERGAGDAARTLLNNQGDDDRWASRCCRTNVRRPHQLLASADVGTTDAVSASAHFFFLLHSISPEMSAERQRCLESHKSVLDGLRDRIAFYRLTPDILSPPCKQVIHC